uniref:translocase of chloroplast 159, chloroplastic n=1 Tax=Erigeron canadensis TaxID=72917 RepID=UPI001CB88C8C|nr:translocase of chloroplast 159, chloroplastic [Erigeron canadensis]
MELSKEDTSSTSPIAGADSVNGSVDSGKVVINSNLNLNLNSDDEFASGEEEAFETNYIDTDDKNDNLDTDSSKNDKDNLGGGNETLESRVLSPNDDVEKTKDEVDKVSEGVVVGVETGGDDEDEDEEVLLVGGGDDNETVKVESVELESGGGSGSEVQVESKDVELESGDDVKLGDAVVEAIDVDVVEPGVAVVKSKEDVETGEVEEGKDVQKVEEDSVVEAIDVDLGIPGKAGVAVVFSNKEEDVVGGTDESGLSEKIDRVLEEVVDKEVVGVTDGKFSSLDVEELVGVDVEKNVEGEVEKEVDYEGRENGSVVVKTVLGDVEDVPVADATQVTEALEKSIPDGITEETEVLDKSPPDGSTEAKQVLDEDVSDDADVKAKHMDAGDVSAGVDTENGPADKFVLEESAEKDDDNEEGYMDDSHSDEEETDGVVFGSSEAAKQFMEELEGGSSNTGGESSQDRSQMVDGQIVTDSDEEDDEEEDGKEELFDSAALAALLKAAADGGSEGGNITFSSQDGSRLFTVERPAGLGSSFQAMRAPQRPATRSSLFNPSNLMSAGETDTILTDEERKKLEKLQSMRVKFLRLVHKLGLSPEDSVAAQVLYRLALIAGRQTGQSFNIDAAKRTAMELEAAGSDLDFSLNILVIGKAGVGKSATINSIFGEEKTVISAFQPATNSVKEIRGVVNGVTVRVFDSPGLRTSVMEQGFNRSVLASAKKFIKKYPVDIVLYVDRLDAQTRDHNDIPLLKTITSSLGAAIWRNAIVTFTHSASAPPEGSNGVPLSYEMFVTQRSHVVQQAIGQAVGDLRMMSPSLMNPVSLVENHQSCRKNRDGQKVLPNGQTWRPQLLMLCYSIKILSEANSLTKPQDPYDNNRRLFGFRVRSPPLPYMLSSMLQSRAHPKLSSEQGGDGGDSDVDLADLTDSDQEEDEDEYDQLPPFKPLKKSQLAKLSREQKKAYFDEYDYRVKLLQKKQWKEELKRMKEMKKRGKDAVNDQVYQEEEGEGDAPAPVAVPLPDMALPPSFDSDNPAYRFRFLEPTSQFLARPVLDTHGWDHDCGYDGVNLEQTIAIANKFPASVSVQVTKDKKDFSINLDSSVSAKHGENVSSMAGFDIQPIGKQLAYIVRGETKFKNLKKNKTAAGISVTFLGENVVTGFKVEDQVALGRQYSIIGSAGTVKFQSDSAYGANIEMQRRELDYPIGQVQSTFGLSIIKWRGDLALGFNSLAQFSAGRNSKVAVRAGINNKMSGQITIKTSSSEHLSLALAAVIPSLISAYKKLWPGTGDKYSAY